MRSLIDTGPPPACPAPFNMAEYTFAAGRATPGKSALVLLGAQADDENETLNFAHLEAQVRGLATGLLDQGLTPGDRVLMRLGNGIAFPLTYLAAISAGLIPVPTSTQLTLPEVRAIASDLQPRLCVADPDVVVPPDVPVLTEGDAIAMTALPPADYAMGAPDRLAYIVYTSGTSGRPRAVGHAHRALWARRMMWAGWYGLTTQDRLMHAGALNWTYTLGTGLLDPWAAGATALIPAPGTSPEDLPHLIAAHDVTLFAASPAHYRQMLKGAPNITAPALRHGLSAGEKLPDATRAAWERATGTPIHEAFGQSECSTFVSGAPDRELPKGALGWAQPGRRIAIVDDAGQPVPRGTPGTLAIDHRDPGLMLGYVGASDETQAKRRGDWYLTGDTASMDASGAITYLGRDDDMMNAGGVRVSPLEVEAALATCPGIEDVAAVEVAVKQDVRVIAAFYTAQHALEESTVSAFAAQRLARYKCPRIYIQTTSLPRGANGKLARGRLRREFEEAHGQA